MNKTLLAAMAALAFLPLAAGQTEASPEPTPNDGSFLNLVDLQLEGTVLPFGIQLDMTGVSDIPLADVTVEVFRGTTGTEQGVGTPQHLQALEGEFDVTAVIPWNTLTEEWYRVAVSDDSNEAYHYYHGYIIHALPGGILQVEDETVPFVSDPWTDDEKLFSLPLLPEDLYDVAQPYATPFPEGVAPLADLTPTFMAIQSPEPAPMASAEGQPPAAFGGLVPGLGAVPGAVRAPLAATGAEPALPSLALAAAGPEDLEEGVLRDNYPYKTTITGKITGRYGGSYPASFPTTAVCSLCLVDVWDSDAGQPIESDSDLLGSVITTMNGDFSLTVSNWDLADNGVDPFVVVRFDYSNSPVQMSGAYTSPVLRTNCANSATCSLGTREVSSGYAANVFIAKAMADGWKAANDQAAWNIGKVKVRIDEAHGGHAEYDEVGREVILGGNHKWNQMVINHEQGHYVEHKARNFGSFPSACSGHGIRIFSNAQCAWNEGFGYFWSLVGSNTGTFKDSDGTTTNVELIHSVIPTPYLAPTDHYEGFITGTLWDLLDSPSDGYDVFDQTLGQVLQPMRSWYPQNSLYDYYIDWGFTGYSTVVFKECAKQNKVIY